MEASTKGETQHEVQRLFLPAPFLIRCRFPLFNRRHGAIVPQRAEEHGGSQINGL